MTPSNVSDDPLVHARAIMLARKCRRVIQAILREAERGDADREFYLIILEGLEDLLKGKKR
jgi:hypothetical protein